MDNEIMFSADGLGQIDEMTAAFRKQLIDLAVAIATQRGPNEKGRLRVTADCVMQAEGRMNYLLATLQQKLQDLQS